MHVKDIIMTRRIVEAVLSHKGSLNHTSHKAFTDNSLPLTRIYNMQMQMKRVKLPPVTLKMRGTTGMYEIIDGRHRFVVSVLNNYKLIPAEIDAESYSVHEYQSHSHS